MFVVYVKLMERIILIKIILMKICTKIIKRNLRKSIYDYIENELKLDIGLQKKLLLKMRQKKKSIGLEGF